jgi:hypothetical protein
VGANLFPGTNSKAEALSLLIFKRRWKGLDSESGEQTWLSYKEDILIILVKCKNLITARPARVYPRVRRAHPSTTSLSNTMPCTARRCRRRSYARPNTYSHGPASPHKLRFSAGAVADRRLSITGCGHFRGTCVVAARSSYATPVISLIVQVSGD